MNQTRIPYIFMRGCTSRGPYFKRCDLPADQETLSDVLVSVLGAGHELNIDGIGGGNAVTTKVAMLSESSDPWADVDFLFAQVSVTDKLVDFKPSCGNILSGVAPAAIEMGLLVPDSEITTVKIRAVNTNARIVATLNTFPGGVIYEGDTAVDGVPDTASPILLQFMDTVGSATGSLLPTGNLVDTIEGISVTCMDVAMPLVIAHATSFGISGYESAAELNRNKGLMKKLESVRKAAGVAMGLGDVSQSVVPKFGLLAPARDGGSLAARYFMPWKCHPTMSVTGAQCIASCLMTPGSIAEGLYQVSKLSPATISVEHPSGVLDVTVDYESDDNGFRPLSAGVIRTARKLADGHVYVPRQVWSGGD